MTGTSWWAGDGLKKFEIKKVKFKVEIIAIQISVTPPHPCPLPVGERE
jgi:hypothetical protein